MVRRRRLWDAVIGMVVASVLVGTLAQPAFADESSSPGLLDQGTPLMPDESPDSVAPLGEAPPEVDLSDRPDSDSVSVPTPAPEPGPAESMESLDDFEKNGAEVLDREEYTQTYKAPDGSKVTELSEVPLNVKVDGRWEPVLTDLQGRGPFALLGRGGAEVVQHPLKPVFAENANEDPLLTISRDACRHSRSGRRGDLLLL